MPRPKLEPAIVDELLFETTSRRPDMAYLTSAAKEVYRLGDKGAPMASVADRLLACLDGKKPWTKQRGADVARSFIVRGLALSALHHGDAGLLRRLRKTCGTAGIGRRIYTVDYRKRISAECVTALVDGIDREPLDVRDQAMKLLGYHADQVGPVIGVVIGELFAPAQGRGYQRKAPAEGALRVLSNWACGCALRSLDAAVVPLRALVDDKRKAAPSRAALAALHTVHGRFDEIEPLVTTAPVRTAILETIATAVVVRRSRQGARKRVPAIRDFDRRVRATMTAIARSASDKAIVAKV